MKRPPPYLQLDLDGKKRAAYVATAVGVHPGIILWGLSELWEDVWRTREDVVTQVRLLGAFGVAAPSYIDALIEYGFLEPLDETWRIRGAKERLFGQAERGSAGGKKTAQSGASFGNLRRGKNTVSRSDSRSGPEATPEAESEAVPKPSQQPTANSQQHKEEGTREARPPPGPVGNLRDGIDERWAKHRGGSYAWTFADERAVAELLRKSNGGVPEILRRLDNALPRASYPVCNGVGDLNRHWNAYATAGPPQRPKDVTRGRVAAEEVPVNAHEVPHEIEF